MFLLEFFTNLLEELSFFFDEVMCFVKEHLEDATY